MDHDSLYETDVCIWAEQQGVALRSLESRGDLPNELDLLNVIEEIEDVGISQFRSVSSIMRLILSHNILIAADADADSVGHLTREVASFRGELIQSRQPSMRRRIDMDRIWRHAMEEATLTLSTFGGNGTAFVEAEIGGRLGSLSLIGIDDLCDESFKFHDLVERLPTHLAAEGPI